MFVLKLEKCGYLKPGNVWNVEIECQILAKCFAQMKKHESGILPNPWNIVAKYNKERKKEN